MFAFAHIPVNEIEDEKYCEVAQGFVQLHGMARYVIHPCEHKCPGDIRRFAENFGIHQIAQPDKAAGKRGWHDYLVQYPEDRFFRYPNRKNPQCQNNPNSATVTGKPAFPYLRNFREVLGVIIPIVKEHVPQPCAEHRADHDVDKCFVEPGFRRFFFLKHAPYDVQANQKTQCKEQAVPSKSERTNGDDLRRDIPSDIGK